MLYGMYINFIIETTHTNIWTPFDITRAGTDNRKCERQPTPDNQQQTLQQATPDEQKQTTTTDRDTRQSTTNTPTSDT
jgi:hypothetical protein